MVSSTLHSRDGSSLSCSLPRKRTLPGLLANAAGRWAAEPAAVTPAGTVSFAELQDRATRVAGALRAAGSGRGDRVDRLLGNSKEWHELFFGIATAGAVAVPPSTWSTRAELEFLLADSKVRLLFAAPAFNDRDFAADLAAVAVGGPAPRIVLMAQQSSHGFEAIAAFLAPGNGSDAVAADGPDPEDDAAILYTSGSTSHPKGVRLTQRGIVENGFNIGERQGLRPGDRVFLSAPLFWSFGSANALPAAFGHGAALVLPEKFEPGNALDTIAADGCTAIYTLPAMTNAMVRHPGFSRDKTRSLRTGVTIGSPQDFMTAVEVLGVPELCNIYGATETYGNCAVTDHRWPVERRAGSQGEPLPGQQFRFRDTETGELAGSGQPGLVEVRGYVTPGYTGVSAALNADLFTEDGFYRTGDVGRLDDHGAFVFVGRDSEMIKRAGINVSPAEVENALLGAPGVAQAAVVGVADAERGERIVAYIVPTQAGAVDAEALMAHCRGLLSKYKLPDRIETVSALPLTSTGKLQRKELKKSATALLAPQSGDGAR